MKANPCYLRRSRWLPWALLTVFLGLLFTLYRQGFSGALYYDDLRPLAALSQIDGWERALHYVFSEISGPLGRPLSMLTLVWNASDWPRNIPAFFAFNAVVHLLDALLVAGIVWRIERLRQGKVAASVWLAVSVGMLWAVLPIHVSTTLIVVQRMTSLSALFVLLGLYFFLLGLEMEQTRPRAGGYLQGAAIVMGTLLAALSKENGLLLPVLAGVTEYTLLQGVTANPGTRRLRLRLCGAYSLLILLALLWQAWASGGVFPGRNFDLKERLLTEPQILFEYLAHAFAPGITTFHPFHEGHPKVVSWQESPLALLAALAWLLALGASGSLRRRHPVLAFAVLWFLAAHLLESSVIGLELYFEHRNHVALFGPCLALVWYIRQVPEKYRRLAIGGFSAYLVLLTLVLGQVTSLWGKPLEAAEDWFLAAHKSPRAAEHLANQYLEAGKGAYALEVMEMQVKDCPECLSSHLQAMLLNCMAGDAEKTQRYYESARLLSLQVASSAGAPAVLSAVLDRMEGGQCKLLSHAQIEALHRVLLEREANIMNARERGALHINLQRIAHQAGDASRALAELEKSYAANPDFELGVQMFPLILASQGRAQAEAFHRNKLCRSMPLHPYRAYYRHKVCAGLLASLDVEAAAHD